MQALCQTREVAAVMWYTSHVHCLRAEMMADYSLIMCEYYDIYVKIESSMGFLCFLEWP